MESRIKSTSLQKKDALALAQGLFESKVLVGRPPTSAQKVTYNTVRSQSCMPRISTGKSRKTKKNECISSQLVNPEWRPFTGGKSLSSNKNRFQRSNNEKHGSGYIEFDTSDDTKDNNSSDDCPRLPKGVEVFESWLSEDCFEEWTGINADPNCFVLLPCFNNTLAYLPPLQMSDEPLLMRPGPKKYVAPKILHNYNYLENNSSLQCQHELKQPAKLGQSVITVPRLRTSEIIKQEIEDLERLLQGIGNPDSSSIVNRYQHEITTLKQMVIETLQEYNVKEINVPDEKPEVPVIQGDLFEFLSRHDEIIAAIEEKREACLEELARLEKEVFEGR